MDDFILIVPVLLFSIVVHEVAHAWQALREGDDTAYKLGRITLNPIPHLDIVGSVIVPLVLYLLPTQIIFGWAKPVPVNPANYRNYRAGDIRVSLAGVVSNMILAAICAVILIAMFRLGGAAFTASAIGSSLVSIFTYGVLINLILAYFNLIPIPPLDGSHVLYHLLPPALGARYRALGRYGVTLVFLLVIVFPGALSVAFRPIFVAFDWVLRMAAG